MNGSSATSVSAPPPLTAHLNGTATADPDDSYAPPTGIHLGRERVALNVDVWDRIDRAVYLESKRTRLCAKFLPPHHVDPHVTSVPSDIVSGVINGAPFSLGSPFAVGGVNQPQLLNADEGATTRLLETWVEFSLTPSQLEQENKLSGIQSDASPESEPANKATKKKNMVSTAVTLATRATNVLCQAEDTVLFQGQFALAASGGNALFTGLFVQSRGTPVDYGLLSVGPTVGTNNLPASQVVQVVQSGGTAGELGTAQYSFETVAQIMKAYSILQANAHYGPYVCVIYYYPYADAFAPLTGTLILPADRINPVMTAGFFGTGTLPGIQLPTTPSSAPAAGIIPNPTFPDTQSMGIVISLGGNTVDHVIGQEPVTAFVQQDPNGNFRFRVFNRFALRVKDASAFVRLEFQ